MVASSSSPIDHIYTSDPHLVKSAGVVKSSISDHFPTFVSISTVPARNKTSGIITYRNMKKFDPESLKRTCNLSLGVLPRYLMTVKTVLKHGTTCFYLVLTNMPLLLNEELSLRNYPTGGIQRLMT